MNDKELTWTTKETKQLCHTRVFDVIEQTEVSGTGMEEKYVEYLGVRLVCHDIPIRPGRNLAVICESAAVNHRQKMMGYNAAKELSKRVQNDIRRQVKKGPENG